MTTRYHLLAALLCGVLLPWRSMAAEDLQLDADGYIRDWLMLAPIALPEGSVAADLLLREQLKDEAQLRPSHGDAVTVNGRKLTWKRVTASTNYFDFNAVLQTQNDHASGFAVTYVECDRDMPDVTMAVASNDQGRIYFNGVDIYAFTEARPLMLDVDKGRVTLKKGVNVIVFKIINEQNSWQGAMRLLDKAGKPLAGVKIRVSP
ncbi:MAG: hypothetical protein JNK85_16010 [Verrucomicrobiales bacterium]|nr:hypothetical protein [Verrucomicrobiales bacterium]